MTKGALQVVEHIQRLTYTSAPGLPICFAQAPKLLGEPLKSHDCTRALSELQFGVAELSTEQPFVEKILPHIVH
jgi:hypothetical protein